MKKLIITFLMITFVSILYAQQYDMKRYNVIKALPDSCKEYIKNNKIYYDKYYICFDKQIKDTCMIKYTIINNGETEKVVIKRIKNK